MQIMYNDQALIYLSASMFREAVANYNLLGHRYRENTSSCANTTRRLQDFSKMELFILYNISHVRRSFYSHRKKRHQM